MGIIEGFFGFDILDSGILGVEKFGKHFLGVALSREFLGVFKTFCRFRWYDEL